MILGEWEPNGQWETRDSLLVDALKKAANRIPWKMVERERHTVTGLELTEEMTEILMVCEAVSRLPRQLRRPVELFFWGGMNQEKAAEHEGLSLATIRRRWGLAKEQLKRIIWEK